jgi:xanthine dehydrogenase molybdenum-binding subunit
VIKASKWGERGLTMEPVYQGEPILAVAAVDELTAAEAIEKIRIDFERLPFVVDPLDTLRPGGPNPRTDGNIWVHPPGATSPAVAELKWTEADFAEAGNPAVCRWARRPMNGRTATSTQASRMPRCAGRNVRHAGRQPSDPRNAQRDGLLAERQGLPSHRDPEHRANRPAIARWLNIDVEKVVFISEYTGGGFGSKITGGVTMIIPALLSKKANAPVMMRISREEETFIGRARPGFQGRMKVGFSKEGRILASTCS